MYQMCLFDNRCKKNIPWFKVIFAAYLLLCTCQAQTSDATPYCRHELDGTSETEQRLVIAVGQRDFCPWSQECNGTCPAVCRGGLKSITSYCTGESKSAQDRCLEGVCLCTFPKLTCYKRERCPCYTSDNDKQRGQEECCIHAIDCLMGMGEDTESKSCFVKPNDSNLEVRCHDLSVVCQELEDRFCDNSCLITHTETPPPVPNRADGTIGSDSTLISTDVNETLQEEHFTYAIVLGSGFGVFFLLVILIVTLFYCRRGKQPTNTNKKVSTSNTPTSNLSNAPAIDTYLELNTSSRQEDMAYQELTNPDGLKTQDNYLRLDPSSRMTNTEYQRLDGTQDDGSYDIVKDINADVTEYVVSELRVPNPLSANRLDVVDTPRNHCVAGCKVESGVPIPPSVKGVDTSKSQYVNFKENKKQPQPKQ